MQGLLEHKAYQHIPPGSRGFYPRNKQVVYARWINWGDSHVCESIRFNYTHQNGEQVTIYCLFLEFFASHFQTVIEREREITDKGRQL